MYTRTLFCGNLQFLLKNCNFFCFLLLKPATLLSAISDKERREFLWDKAAGCIGRHDETISIAVRHVVTRSKITRSVRACVVHGKLRTINDIDKSPAVSIVLRRRLFREKLRSEKWIGWTSGQWTVRRNNNDKGNGNNEDDNKFLTAHTNNVVKREQCNYVTGSNEWMGCAEFDKTTTTARNTTTTTATTNRQFLTGIYK